MKASRTILGAVEPITVPELGIFDVLAKVDTGAYTGALHCEEIHLTKQAGGKQQLQFRPISKRHALQTVTEFRRKRVRSASGHSAQRYIIPVSIIVQGKAYKTHIGLTKRKDMTRQILLGRRFLRENNILVDVSQDDVPEDQTERL